MSTQGRKPGRRTVLRDIVSYVLGWGLIIYQALAVPPKDVNEWFLLLGGSLVGVPGIAEILKWRATGTAAPPPSPPSPDSPEAESSSSSVT